ncbi:hypothetical protein OEV82_08955 [Caldibacillus thermolactis]|jgi:hypothetical protein|uniref:Uncharacterized protein n=1 Tax=Pallidibacillus thermolactis TaxID=251051 RepID=A0ABT2WIR2_9BACI|nr:hypothetical protein [Pallidibacillus thermolactis]MCU9594584.1 hypothetical protein [Pallidibacillus thermolactis]
MRNFGGRAEKMWMNAENCLVQKKNCFQREDERRKWLGAGEKVFSKGR